MTPFDELREAASEALEVLEDHIGVDVVDGDYGIPEPNRVMHAAYALREALDRVENA